MIYDFFLAYSVLLVYFGLKVKTESLSFNMNKDLQIFIHIIIKNKEDWLINHKLKIVCTI